MGSNAEVKTVGKRSSISDKVLWVLTVALMVSFVVFEQEARGKYIYMGIAVCFFVVYAIKSNYRIPLRIELFHLYTALFAIYCIISMVWAQDSNLAYRRGAMVVKVVLFMWILYLYYRDETSIKRLLDVVCVSGFIVALYAIMTYGLSTIREIVEAGERAQNSFANINTIGMMSATALVIAFSRLVNRKYSLNMILSLPCLLMVIASGSRKAFTLLNAGIIMLLFLKVVRNNRNFAMVIIRVAFTAVLVVVVGRMIISLPIMKSVVDPMTRMLNYFTGSGRTDESVRGRMSFIPLAMQQFVKTPLFGMGIGNSSILIGRDTYLHNNYIEMLACGGIIGFLVYYAPFIYSAKNMLQLRRVEAEESDLCLVLLILFLIMDFGQVSYFSKDTYFYLMIFLTNVKILKKAAQS